MAIAYIGLGANLGDRVSSCRKALELLSSPEISVLAVSSFYRTPPVGCINQPEFVNAAAKLQTALSPQELVTVMQTVEGNLGKKVAFRWGPRVIDLDLLLYDNLALRVDDLEIPHPRLHERAFVLTPLAELDPEVRHPRLGLTAGELLSRLPTSTFPKVFS